MKLYCMNCGIMVIDIIKGIKKKNIVIYCEDCSFNNKRENPIPDCFSSIFGNTFGVNK